MNCGKRQGLVWLTKVLTAHVNNQEHEKALRLFYKMHKSEPFLDTYTFPLALKSCAALNCPQLAKTTHAHITKSHFLHNPFLICALINAYSKCALTTLARQLFDQTPHPTVVVWNAMISGYCHSRMLQDALTLFHQIDVTPNHSTFNSLIAALSGIQAVHFSRGMWKWGLKGNLITLLALLPACVHLGSLPLVKEVHCYGIRNGIDRGVQLRSGLVEAYGRCGCVRDAVTVFRSMEMKDVVAWSSMISAYALHGEATVALQLFNEMELENVVPDGITFFGVLKACSHAGLADEALCYFSRMQDVYGIQASSDHYSCLVDVLSRAGRLSEAYNVLRCMPVKATAKAWGALLGACQTYGDVELAEIAGRALFEIEPDNAANYVILGRIYASLGRHDEAERVRQEMRERRVKISPGSSWVVSQG